MKYMNLKKHWKTAGCALALSVLLLGGCTQQAAQQMEKLGVDDATEAALKAAGVAENRASFQSATLETQNGQEFYRIVFTVDGVQYEYNVDALTGMVITSTNDSQGSTAASSQTPAQPPVAASSSQANDATAASSNVEIYNGPNDALSGSQANTGSTNGSNQTGNANNAVISSDEAQSIALGHAGLNAADVTVVQNRLEWDDGRQIYDVEFYTADYTEYDYEIDAVTGEILTYDYDAEYAIPPAGSNSGSMISEAEARSLALAQVPGATEQNLYEFHIDRDDGRTQYEGAIVYDGMEYEFEIDAYSGAFRNWESEPFGW